MEFRAGSQPYSPEISKSIENPGGMIFRAGTLCEGSEAAVASCRAGLAANNETLTPGQSRACLQGPPATHTNIFYPMDSDWSKNRRPNVAAFVAQVDVFGLDSRIDDPTLRGDYWFGCYVRDVRAMQARHSDGRTWNDSDNLTYYGREGQSAHYAAKSWLAYWLEHQNGPAPFVYENKPYELEFSRIANIEAEDPDNTLTGNVRRVTCDRYAFCLQNRGVELGILRTSGAANSVTLANVNAPTSGLYNLHIIYVSHEGGQIEVYSRIKLSLEGDGQYSGEQYIIRLTGLGRGRTGVAHAEVFLNAGNNNLTIERLENSGEQVPIIDRVILGLPVGQAPPVDIAPPQLRSATIDATSVVLAYDEALDEGSVPAPGYFTVSVTDSVTAAVSEPAVTAVSLGAGKVALTLSAAVRADDTVTLDYRSGGNRIRDKATNAAGGVNDYAVVNITAAATGAELSALGLADERSTVEVLSPVFAAGTKRYSTFVRQRVSSVTVTATAADSRASLVVEPADADNDSANGHQVPLAVGPNMVTVTVTAEDGTTTAVYTITVDRTDEAGPPLLRTAVVDGASVVLVHHEHLDETSEPATGDFSVSVTDSVTSAVSAPALTGVSVNSRSVTLTLSAAVRAGDTVTLDYTPGAAPIQDDTGEKAMALAGYTLVNATAKATEATLSALGLSDAQSAVLALWPVFAAAVTTYSASADHEVEVVTLVATAVDPRASVAVVPGDAASAAAGYQLPLDVGANTVTVTVTAEDGTTTAVYTVAVFRAQVVVRTIDWQWFSRGAPEGHNANDAKGWLLTTLKYALNTWWNEYKDFDAQDSSTYLDFVGASNAGSTSLQQLRNSTTMALALAAALRTGAYDAAVTGVSRDLASARALKLIRSLAYRHDVNAPSSQTSGRWAFDGQSGLFAAYAGLAAWLMWDELAPADQTNVIRMIVAEANQYRSPRYYRDASGTIKFGGRPKARAAGQDAFPLSLAAVMMPNHPNADTWRSNSIHLMLASFARPEEVGSSVEYHGHPLSDWLTGSNIYNDGTVLRRGVLNPDELASGLGQFNGALLYSLANLPTPEAARFNIDRVMEALVELNLVAGSRPYSPESNRTISNPGGTIFRPGTLCSGTASEVATCRAGLAANNETLSPGQSRACLQGPPATGTNVFFPMGSSLRVRRSNLAAFVAQADAFSFDSRIDDPTLRGDYWFGCFARDVRAMQARNADGRVWTDGDNNNYFGREGQSAEYASMSWLAYWLQHQNGPTPFVYESKPYELEFSRTAAIEAERPATTLRGTARTRGCSICSGDGGVELRGTGADNGATITNISAPTGGRYNLHIIYNSQSDREIQLTLEGVGQYSGEQYIVRLAGPGRANLLGTASTKIWLNAGNNDLAIEKLPHSGTEAPMIDRVILGSPVGQATPADSAAPELRSATIDATRVVLAYDEALDDASQPATGDFSVSVTDSVTSAVSQPTVTAVTLSASKVALTLSAAASFADTVTLSYTPGTDPIRDEATNPAGNLAGYALTNITAAPAGTPPVVVPGDTAPPGLSSATVDAASVVLVYGEALDEASQPAIGDFSVSVTDSVTAAVSVPVVSAVSVVASEVTLTLSAAVRFGDTVTLDYTAGTDPVRDEATNPAANLDDHAVTNVTAAAADAQLSTLYLLDAQSAVVALSPVSGTGDFSTSVANVVAAVTVVSATADSRASVAVSVGGAAVAGGAQVPLAVGDTVITVTVTAEDGVTTAVYTITVTRAPAAPTDSAAPGLSSATVDAASVVLAYDEALDEASQPAIGDFSVSVTDSVTAAVSVPVVSAVSVVASEVTLTLSAAVRFGDTVTLDYTAGTDPVRDEATNPAANLDDHAVTNVTAAAADAQLSTLYLLDAQSAVVALSPVSGTGDFSTSVANVVASVTVVSATADSRASVAVSVGGAAVADGAQVPLAVGDTVITVTVTAEDGVTTAVHTITVTRAPAAPTDSAAPGLSSATVDDAGVVLAYDEALDEASQPAIGDFSVSVTDSVTAAVSVPVVSAVSVVGSEVTLTLSAAVRFGDTVTLDYTAGTDPVRDEATNPAANLDDHALTNVTAAAADAQLSTLYLLDAQSAVVALSPVSGTGDFSASVANVVASVAVVSATADSRASVAVSVGGVAVADGAQVPLAVGDTVITVTVTAEDGVTTAVHTITVTRA